MARLPFLLFIVTLGVSQSSEAGQDRPAQTQALQAFTEQVEREWPGTSWQHSITVESLQLLAAAIDGVTAARKTQPEGYTTELDRLRTEIATFANEKPDTSDHTVGLQHTLLTAASLMRRIAGSLADEEPLRSRLVAIRRAADGVDRKQPLHRQPDVLERYFHQSAAFLRELSSR
jgi:hypothetical protein